VFSIRRGPVEKTKDDNRHNENDRRKVKESKAPLAAHHQVLILRYCLGIHLETEENHDKTLVRITGLRDEISTWDLLNMKCAKIQVKKGTSRVVMIILKWILWKHSLKPTQDYIHDNH
jgi:hypothetical protein